MQRRKRKRETGETDLADRGEAFAAKLDQLKISSQQWHRLWALVTAVGTHGTRKEEDQTWKQFFEVVLDEEIKEVPAAFLLQPALPFQDMLLVLASHVSSLDNRIAQTEKLLENNIRRHDKLKAANAKREEAARKQLDMKLNPETAQQAKAQVKLLGVVRAKITRNTALEQTN